MQNRYYERKPLSPSHELFQFYTHMRQRAEALGLFDQKWFAELMLDGLPVTISNFVLEGLFTLLKPNDK